MANDFSGIGGFLSKTTFFSISNGAQGLIPGLQTGDIRNGYPDSGIRTIELPIGAADGRGIGATRATLILEIDQLTVTFGGNLNVYVTSGGAIQATTAIANGSTGRFYVSWLTAATYNVCGAAIAGVSNGGIITAAWTLSMGHF